MSRAWHAPLGDRRLESVECAAGRKVNDRLGQEFA